MVGGERRVMTDGQWEDLLQVGLDLIGQEKVWLRDAVKRTFLSPDQCLFYLMNMIPPLKCLIRKLKCRDAAATLLQSVQTH